MTDRELKFYPASHRYRLDGEWVAGVTTIIGVLDKPGLKKWAAASVAEFVADNRPTVEHLYRMGRTATVAALKEVPWKARDDASDRGKILHAYAEDIVKGNAVDVPDEHVGVMESAIRFMQDWGIEPVLVEEGVGSREHRYGGTLDLVADHNRGPRAIFDWKSGKRIYASAAFQCTAYAFAEFYGLDGTEYPMDELEIGAAYGVHIRDDGYSVHPLRFGPDVFDEFLTLRRAFDINKRAEGNWKIPGSGYVGAEVVTEAVA
jgi:hypothetical protein